MNNNRLLGARKMTKVSETSETVEAGDASDVNEASDVSEISELDQTYHVGLSGGFDSKYACRS